MTDSQSHPLQVARRPLVVVTSVIIMAACIASLWIWHLGHWHWLALSKNAYPIAPLTALLLTSLAVSWLGSIGKSARQVRAAKRLAIATASIALLQEILPLVGLRMDWNTWLSLPGSNFRSIPVGLTATTTMICVSLSGLAIVALTLDRKWRWVFATGALVSGSIAAAGR